MSAAAQQAIVPDEAGLREALAILNRYGVIYRLEGDRGKVSVEMLSPLRQFAVGLDPAVTVPVWERCLLFFAAIAAWAQSTEFGEGGGRPRALQTLAAEFGNLQESMLLGMEKGCSVAMLERIHSKLINSYQFHAVTSRELLRRLDGFFRMEARANARANTLKSLGDLESRLGNVDGARERYAEALKLYESEQASLGRANTLQSLGDLHLGEGSAVEARKLFREALVLYETEQEPGGIAQTCTGLAILFHVSGQADLAADAAAHARAAARASNVPAIVDYVENVLTPLGL
jgi:tetratricopeptide (TPR) repeat protein